MSIFASVLSAQSFQDTVKRFPLSCLYAVLMFFVAVSENHNWDIFPQEEPFAAFFAGGFFIFGLFVLLSESLDWSLGRQYALSFLIVVAFGTLVFTSDQYERHILFIFPALLLLIMSAPFVFRESGNTAFWHFNAVMWVNVVISMIAAIILGGGASAAVAAIDFLFGVDVDHDVYADIWAFACILFAPFYVFSQLPRDFNASVAIPAYEIILKFIANWLLAPLVVIYMVILYAYFLKIVFEWNLPQGQLASITTGFGGAGVAVYLISWPFRETGSWLVRAVHKYFFPALIVPVLMMAVSIIVRLNEYGLTEERYMIALTALWFAVVIILFLMRQKALKLIPLILGCAMIVASFGPWGAVSLSGYSQFQRLQALLIQNNLLQNGKIVPLEGEISFADEKGINSILRYFDRRKELDRIKKAFPLKEGVWGDYNVDMIKQMNLEYISEYVTEKHQAENQGYISYDGMFYKPRGYDIGGYRYFYDIKNLRDKVHVPDQDGETLLHAGPPLELKMKDGKLHIKVDEEWGLELDVAAYIQQQDFTERNMDKNRRLHEIEGTNDGVQAKLILQHMYGKQEEGQRPDINEISFYLLLNMRKE